jgi:integrase
LLFCSSSSRSKTTDDLATSFKKVCTDRLADTTAKEETAKLRPWLRGMFESGWCYGWREDEIQSLRVRQFDPIARIILLEPGETKNDVPRQTPPMDETIYQLISACTVGKSPDDFVFTRDDWEPIRDFRVAWWKACVARRESASSSVGNEARS